MQYSEDQVIPYAERMFPAIDFFILHDNSPIHTSYETLGYLVLRFGPERVIPHPPYSPDLTPIRIYSGYQLKKLMKRDKFFA